ncbi:MAG: hypothetical protein KDD11_02730 [Acidobacteria bacterium]|nr:hypothetical protein [Acidobacteriota bacterium]
MKLVSTTLALSLLFAVTLSFAPLPASAAAITNSQEQAAPAVATAPPSDILAIAPACTSLLDPGLSYARGPVVSPGIQCWLECVTQYNDCLQHLPASQCQAIYEACLSNCY